MTGTLAMLGSGAWEPALPRPWEAAAQGLSEKEVPSAAQAASSIVPVPKSWMGGALKGTLKILPRSL